MKMYKKRTRNEQTTSMGMHRIAHRFVPRFIASKCHLRHIGKPLHNNKKAYKQIPSIQNIVYLCLFNVFTSTKLKEILLLKDYVHAIHNLSIS